MNLALVHDWLNQRGGAENVLEALVDLYTGAPVFTSIYAPDLMPQFYQDWDIRVSWMDSLPAIHRHHQPYLPLYASTFGRMRLDGYDAVLTNKSGFCHWIDPGDAVHVCYCLAPTRYVWQFDQYIQRERIPAAGILRPFVEMLKRGDYAAAQGVDAFIAISSDIRERIARFYNRDSVIIFPPVDIDRFEPASKVDDYYLVVSRLIPYKRIDLAVEVCTKLGLPLVVAGDGRLCHGTKNTDVFLKILRAGAGSFDPEVRGSSRVTASASPASAPGSSTRRSPDPRSWSAPWPARARGSA